MSRIKNNFNLSSLSLLETLNYLNNHPAIDSSDKKMAAVCKKISYITSKRTGINNEHLKILVNSTLNSMNKKLNITVQEQMKMSEILIKVFTDFRGAAKKEIKPVFPSKQCIHSYLRNHKLTKAYSEAVLANMATFFQHRTLGTTAIKLYTQLVTDVLIEDLRILRIEIEKMNQRFSQALLDCSRSP